MLLRHLFVVWYARDVVVIDAVVETQTPTQCTAESSTKMRKTAQRQ